MKRFFSVIALLAILVPTVLATGCSSSGAQGSGKMDGLQMADLSVLPQEMQSAPTTVRESYQFAVANPDALKNVPCYCGCKGVGHTSNYSCFVKDAPGNGKIVYDKHALGCSLCVDIAQDVMKGTRSGQSPGQIRTQILSTYSQYGPPNQ